MNGRSRRCQMSGLIGLAAFLAVLIMSTNAFPAEFIVNGGLNRALTGGNRCETSPNAFCCWTLTPENGGGTNYSADEFWPDTRLCGCVGVPCQIYPEISQTFGISGGGAYTLTWDQRNDQEDCSSRATMWANMTAVGTVYYFKDAAMTQPCSPASQDTGNVTSGSKGVWAPISISNTSNAPLHGTAPADCRYIEVVIKALSKTNTCTATGGTVRAWTEIDNVSFTSTAFTKTSGPEPFITQQPASQTLLVAEQATFTVAATGNGPFTYRWQKKAAGGSFSDISGATSPSYATPALAASDDGSQYRCRVSNACTTVYSDAATLIVLDPVEADTIVQAKGLGNGTVVRLADKPVSARSSSAYWIQDETPPSGIRIKSTAFPEPGSRVTVVGNLATTNGERSIEPLLERWGTPGNKVRPHFLVSSSLGGADLNSLALGVPGSSGPNNVGLLVTLCGRVGTFGSGYYYLNDGVALADGTRTGSEDNIGVKVMTPPGSLLRNDWTQVTGVSSILVSDTGRHSAVIPSGCTMPNAELAVTVNPTVMCEGQSATVSVALTEPDVTYQLRNSTGNINVGSPVAGTGGTINLPTGILGATTTFNVYATRNVGACSVQLLQTRTVTVNPLPIAGLAVSATQAQLDVGQSTTINVTNSQAGVLYQLRKNSDNSSVGSPVVGTGGTIGLPTGTFTQTGIYVYNVLATNAATGCSRQLTQTVTITVGTLGNLSGKVMNALGLALSGATVQLAGGVYSTTTASDGTFSFVNVPAGTYTMTAVANTYQAHTWSRVIVTANRTNPVPHFYLAHTWSKLGWHIQSLQPTGLGSNFLMPIANCGKTCQMVKGMGNLGVGETAYAACPGSFCVGRVNELPDGTQVFAFDEYFDSSGNLKPGAPTAEQLAEDVYYHGGGHGLKWLMEQNPRIHVWEVVNEWDSHYDYQCDFFLRMMDLAESDGHRIAAFSSSAGTPSLDPNYKFIGDTRTELENLARVCARAKASGGHMLALHEYGYSGMLKSDFESNPYGNVLRYRKFHDYLASYTATDDPEKGWIGADCPIIITEACGQNCSASAAAQIADLTWYDSKVREDSYLLGVAIWNIGVECDKSNLYSDLASYICAN
jgi:hypothetical protein